MSTLERFKNFLTLAHQASYIAAEANLEAQRDFLRRAVSNLKLLDGNLIISYTSEFKTLAETANEDMESLTGLELILNPFAIYRSNPNYI